LLLGLAAPAAADVAPLAALPRIAIIIDDLGYALGTGRRVVALPGPVACAVLPATPRARLLAELARQNGKDVLLHLPLQANDPPGYTEPGGLVLDMSRGQFSRAFAASLDSVPHVVGVNNHRGSLLTRHPGHMGWLMEEIRARDGLFFVDSYTTHESVALDLAFEAGVPAVRRDVFLDNDREPARLAAEFARLTGLARRHGLAVGIGHPYPETLSFLERALPRLRAEGIELISISDMVRLRGETKTY
jgi:polysaccharide deacetylase 2 family uncharacterized protein YibQ